MIIMKMYIITTYSTVITHKSINMKTIKSRGDALQLKYIYMLIYIYICIDISLYICVSIQKSYIIPSHLSRTMSHKTWNFAIVCLCAK